MATYCVFDRENNVVKTKDGNRSILFDKIASIPFVVNREKAEDLYSTVLTDKFKSIFGKWDNHTSFNRKAVNNIRKQAENILSTDVLDRILYSANSMQNPRLVTLVEKPEQYVEVKGLFYSEDLSLGTNFFLYDHVIADSVSIQEQEVPDGETIEGVEIDTLSADYNPVVEFNSSNGNNYTVIREGQMVQNVNTLEEFENKNPFIYDNGEPKLFFRTPSGMITEDYGVALDNTQEGKVEVGFIHTNDVVEAENQYGLDVLGNDVVFFEDALKLNNPESFESIATLDSNSNQNSKNGLVNYLIRLGLLSPEKKRINNNYYLYGAGALARRAFSNSRVVFGRLEAALGRGYVSMHSHGGIEFTDKVPENKVRVLNRNSGRYSVMDKSDIKQALMEGRYSELSRTYADMDLIASSLFMSEFDMSNQNQEMFFEDEKRKDRSLQVAMLRIMETLGLNMLNMTDYLERYSEKMGTAMDSKALADLSEKIIALSENATVEDLTEEVSHFILETYQDQESLKDLFPAIEATEEWANDSGRYYQIYSQFHSGEMLENVVHKEIMGKILAREIASRFNSGMVENATVEKQSLLGRLWGKIVEVFESFMNTIVPNRSNQKEQLNSVIKEVADLVLNDNMYAFNTDYLSDKNYVMFSAGTVGSIDFLKKQVNNIEARIRSLNKIGISSSDLQAEKSRLNEQVIKNETLMAFRSLVSIADGQMRALENQLRAAEKMKQKDPSSIVWDLAKQQNVNSLNTFISPLMKEIYSSIENSTDLTREQKVNLLADVNLMAGRLNAINSKSTNLNSSDGQNVLERFGEIYDVDENGKNYLKEYYTKIHKDIGVITRFYGTLEHSSNPLLNLLGRVISSARLAGNIMAKEWTDPLARKVEQGWNFNRFKRVLSKGINGATSYLKNRYDFDRFYSDMNDETLNIIKSLPTIKGQANPYANMSLEDLKKIKRSDKFLGGVIGTQNGIPSTKDLNEVERVEFNRKMEQWKRLNTERVYMDAYYDMIEQRYKDAADNRDEFDSLNITKGTPIADESIEFFRNLSRRRYEIKSQFMTNGRVDWNALNQNEEAVQGLSEINRSRKIAKSDYDPNTGELKTGEDMRLAKDIQAMDKLYQDEMSKQGPRAISAEFMKQLMDVQKKGYQAAYEFVMNNGRLGFSDLFWDALSADSFSTRLENMDWTRTELSPHEIDRVQEVQEQISEIRKKRSEILKQYTEFNNPMEIDFDGMPKAAVDRVQEHTKDIESLQTEMYGLAQKVGLDRNSFINTENTTNDAYDQTLKDSGITDEIQFIKKHITDNGLSMINDLEKHFRFFLKEDTNFRFTLGERKFIAEQLGWEDYVAEDRRTFYQHMVDYGMTEEKAKDIVVAYGKTKLYPYFKRFAPAGFNELLGEMRRGNVNMVDFVNGVLSNTSSDPLVASLTIDLQNEWYEDNNQYEQYLNPNFDRTGEYGYLQPRADKYRSDEYFDYFGIVQDADGNDRATRNTDDWDMIQDLKEIKRKSLEGYGERDMGFHNLYEIPQISKSTVERAVGFAKSPIAILKNSLKDTFFSRVDAPQYGQDTEGNVPVDESLRVMPKYYLYRLEDANDVSTDLAYSYMMLASQAAQYSANMDSIADVLAIENELLDTQFTGGKKADVTNSYRMFKEWMDAYYFGVRQNKKLTAEVGGYEVDFTKTIHLFDKAVRMANIAMSPVIAATASATNGMNIALERAVGEFIDSDSFSKATAQQPKMFQDFWTQYGTVNRTNKTYVLGERMKIFNLQERAHSAGFNRIVRSMNNLPYKMLEILNSPFAPQLMATIMYGYRVYDGKFMNYNRFKTAVQSQNGSKVTNKELMRQWKALGNKNLYDTVKIVDGNIVYDQSIVNEVGKAEIDRVMDAAQREIVVLNQKTDGTISQEDKSTASRNFLLSFTTAHRGWFTIGFQRRWKKKHYNFSTNKIEEGHYWTLLHFVGKVFGQFTQEKSVNGLGNAIKDNWNLMEDYEKTNMKRILADIAMLVAMGALSVIAAGISDDDDNKDSWAIQMMAFVALRTANEMYSVTEPFLSRNAIEMAQQPFVPINQLSELTNFSNWSFKEVNSGAYEGHSKLYKMLVKQTYLKHYYTLKTTDDLKKSLDYWRVLNVTTLPFGQKETKAEREARLRAASFNN